MAKVKPIPEGMHTLTTQLSLDGASEAIELYKKAFGAEEIMRAPDPTGKKIWHAHLRIGDSTLFVNDIALEMGGRARTADLWIYLGDVDAAYQRATAAGLKAEMPPVDMFWGDRMSTVSDRWGNKFNIATHQKDLTPVEMQKGQDEFLAQMAKGKK